MLERLFFNRERDRFVVLADDRILYIPQARGGRAYVVPDWQTAERLRQRFKVADRVASFALGTGIVLASLVRLWTVIPLLVFLGLFLPRWMERVVAESLPEAHDPDAIRAARRATGGPVARGEGLLGAALGLGAVAYGLLRLTQEGWSDLLGLGTAGAGVVLLFTSLGGWGEERPEDAIDAASVSPGSQPNEPRYF